MPIVVVALERMRTGQAGHLEGPAPLGDYSAVFEDDGDTGYFYALDYRSPGQPIQDAIHIYNASDSGDTRSAEVKIGWSADNQSAVLILNGLPYAVFDFAAKYGYGRSGFPAPAPGSGWSRHEWSESALKRFGAES